MGSNSGRTSTPNSLPALIEWLGAALPGTKLDAAALHAQLVEITPTLADPAIPIAAETPATWRERLWVAPAETRLGVRELAEAIGRPLSWCYRHTSTKTGVALLPYRKLDGELVFVASEIRTWIAEHEEIIERGQMSSPRRDQAR
ncbi:MAG: hypothetical protein JWM41_2174 [Gemmatimonadetes bacterium]|nr:hypothetical protein [Gemmatimonadota bacterium]